MIPADRPITPEEARSLGTVPGLVLPKIVLQVVNKLLIERLRNGEAVILQSEIVDRLVAEGLRKEDIFEKGYLDFEPFYREQGWTVNYQKGYFDETPHVFIFESP